MLESKDQLLLLQLLASVVVFLEATQDEGNPFVKKLSTKKEKEARELLVNVAGNLQHLLPLIYQLNKTFQEAKTPENTDNSDIKNYM